MAFVRANSIGSLGLVVMVVVVTKAEVAVVERERGELNPGSGDNGESVRICFEDINPRMNKRNHIFTF